MADPLCGPVNRPLCPAPWATAVHALVSDIVGKNFQMFEHFQEISEEDILNEAALAGCRSYQKFDPRRAAPSRWIRRVTKCRLIDLYRQARLKHQRDRDYAPRQQSRIVFDHRAFSSSLEQWMRAREDRCTVIPGNIFAILTLWRFLGRYCCRLQEIPAWREIPLKLRKRLLKSQYDALLPILRETVGEFCHRESTPVSRTMMDPRTAANHASGFDIE